MMSVETRINDNKKTVMIWQIIGAFVIFLKVHPVLHGAEIISQMHLSRRLNTGENGLLVSHGCPKIVTECASGIGAQAANDVGQAGRPQQVQCPR